MHEPLLLDAATAAVYAGVRPATLRVWAHRYRLTKHHIGGRSHYDLHELADVLARRAAGDGASALDTSV